ncbi:RcnB family protein [Stenotrophomonas sp. YIM B06876]|uniref:RcnB family protein n=1 Tax=Stenotrophomonas sp. YIM B06876 TaxID=3060211 RepID=UPI00273A50A7|nr:RcnB family protein [Stenotrophomonas sp. YIM B06876]
MKMKRLAVIAMTSLLAVCFTAPAFAAGDRDHDRGRHGWDDRGHGKHDRDRGRRDDRHYNSGYREGYRDARYNDRRYYAPPPRVVYRPYGFQRGHRYSNYYRGPVYVVNDYGRYNMRRPPRGYHWIRDDRGNMLMVAIATGIIADLVLHH